MSPSHPLDLLLAGAPGAPGADVLFERVRRAREAGAALRVILTGQGVRWAGDERLERLARGTGVPVALCSRSAREQGVAPDALPAWIRWSSLTTWISEGRAGGRLWGLFP
jgi:thiamine pyrophosphate-dependent acetolactate synthase large subunit-like protein